MKTVSTETLRKKVGTKIKEFRKAQGISQKQLGYEAGLSREQISYLEGGHKNVTLDTLYAISVALDVPIKEFFDGFR